MAKPAVPVFYGEQNALYQSLEWFPHEFNEPAMITFRDRAVVVEFTSPPPIPSIRILIHELLFQIRTVRGILWGFSLGRHDFEFTEDMPDPVAFLHEVCAVLQEANLRRIVVPAKMKEKYGIYLMLGEGSFGKVYAAIHWPSLSSVAIKQFKTEEFKKYRDDVDNCFQELWLMHSLQKWKGMGAVVNCVSLCAGQKSILYGAEFHFICEIMPFVPFTMETVITGADRLTHYQISKLMGQLLAAAAWLHVRGIYHRDIKPDNILLDNRGHAILTDYSLSMHVSDTHAYSNHYVCSRSFRAPELLFDSKTYDDRVDSWSLGVVLLELLLHRRVFQHVRGDLKHHVKDMVHVLGRPSLHKMPYPIPFKHLGWLMKSPPHPIPDWRIHDPEHIPPNAGDLLNRLLTWNYEERWTALEAMFHPFIAYAWDTDELARSVEYARHIPEDQPPFQREKKNLELLHQWVQEHGEEIDK